MCETAGKTLGSSGSTLSCIISLSSFPPFPFYNHSCKYHLVLRESLIGLLLLLVPSLGSLKKKLDLFCTTLESRLSPFIVVSRDGTLVAQAFHKLLPSFSGSTGLLLIP